MKRDKPAASQSTIEAFRLPRPLSKAARQKAKSEDITFSQLMRRAIRRELGITEPQTTAAE